MTDSASPAPTLPQVLFAGESEPSAAAIARHLAGKFQVVYAADGLEAWNILASNPAIEVIIVDPQMPRPLGQELLAKIRGGELPPLRDMPVLVMTTPNDEPAREQAFATGASDFIGKPIDAFELIARVGVHQKLA